MRTIFIRDMTHIKKYANSNHSYLRYHDAYTQTPTRKATMRPTPALRSIALAALLAASSAAALAAGSINIYSARHYKSDEAMYAGFTKATGIAIKRVDADDVGILNRLKSEGANSPADVVLMVDGTRLWKADQDGLLAPVQSALLEKAIPPKYHAEKSADGITWFGFSNRARLIVYDKGRVKKTEVDDYEKLADPVNKGKICTRSGSHPYNLSLFGALMAHWGEAKTQEWMKGVVANFARAPKGADTDQIKAVASGECAIALTNSYYLARLMKSSNSEDKTIAERVGVVFPDQASYGTHMNIAGGAVAKYSKNKADALRFLEYLASPEAQEYFANGNNEWPIVPGMKLNNPALKAMTRGQTFKTDDTSISTIAANQAKVQQMLDRAGFQ
jgi:iron(III) transport system substrate-binding protein